ncbi:MAG TPA: hypothetical protein VE219_04550, partial [Candidatus Sulfotelmatobacter sp.]|nr:hypothetical protein [Candidatus Sulfotelmatobacter sp.]
MTAVAVPTVGAPRHKLGSAARAIRAHWFLPTILTSDAALLSFTEAHHEPWFDEAQAWLIARDSSITE